MQSVLLTDFFSFSYISFRYASVWLYTKRQQPNVFAICILCSLLGYILYLYAFSIGCHHLFTLGFLYIFSPSLLKHFLHCMQNIRPSKKYVLSRNDRHCWFCFYHIMNMAFVCLHISNNDFMLLTYLIRKLLYIIWYLFWHQ